MASKKGAPARARELINWPISIQFNSVEETMDGVIVHVSNDLMAAVIACETEDYMVVDLKTSGQFNLGDSLDTRGLWFGEHGKMLNKKSGRMIEVKVEGILRDLLSACNECDDPQLNQ